MSATVSARSFVSGSVKVASVKNGSRTVMKAGNWLPGSETPSYLDSLPASYGFDPLGLGKDAASLKRFQESEVIHGRWAMLGVAGSLGAELLGQGDWYSAPLPLLEGGHSQYMGAEVPFDLGTLLAIEFAAMAGAESLRGGADAEKRIYPGGTFDPMGMASDEKKVKEIKKDVLPWLPSLDLLPSTRPLELLQSLPSPLTWLIHSPTTLPPTVSAFHGKVYAHCGVLFYS
eukprot:jgi/Picre1/29278/NNA_004670.t1